MAAAVARIRFLRIADVRGLVRHAAAVIAGCALSLGAACVMADQTEPALDGLFGELAAAESEQVAARIESNIWQLWLVPPDDEAGLLMARIEGAMRVGDTDLAMSLCDELVTREPDYAEAWNKRATLRYLTGDHDGSVADIQRTVALEPRHFGAISGLGLIFLQRGDLQGALDAFEAVLDISPASRSARDSAARVRDGIESSDI